MEKQDIVIIGSGLGGLLCGYILSKEGYKVGVVEKHHQVGGCLQNFKRDGCFFDTGVHYIGSLNEGQVLNRYFKYFGLFNDVEYKQLDKNGFDIIRFDDDKNSYPFAQGFDNFRENLQPFFPGETESLKKFTDSLEYLCDHFPLYNISIERPEIHESEFYKDNAVEFINSIVKNQKLQYILAGNNPLYAGVAEKTPYYVYALINHSFIDSSYRIVDGSEKIAESLVNSIERQGGKVYTRKEATHFNMADNGHIKSLDFKDGDRVEAKQFISGMHPAKTMELFDPGIMRKAYRDRLSSLENTVSNFSLYVTFKKDSFPYYNYNLYHYKDKDPWKTYHYEEKDWPEFFLFLSPAIKGQDKFSESAVIFTYMNYNEVLKWENTTVGRRGNDYEDFKQNRAERMIEFIDKRLPGFKSSIKSYYASTPLTYKDYTGTSYGSMYGVLKDSTNPLKTLVSPRTKVPNLLLTGQNIILHGVLGVTIGSIYTCSELIGMEYLVNKVRKNSE